MSTTLLELGRQVLAAQRFSRLLGAELTAWDASGVQLELAISEQLTQQRGFVHGGVLAYLADNALTFAGGSALGPEVITGELKINYLRSARGSRLVARAQVIYAGKTQAVCRCDVFDVGVDGERLCAAAQGTIVRAAAVSPQHPA